MTRFKRGSGGLFLKSESGGALIELAVVMPVLILIAVGVMDYSRVYFTSVAVSNAARAGAEYGTAVAGNQIDQTKIQNFAKADGAEVGSITVTSRTFCECAGVPVLNCAPLCTGNNPPEVFVEVNATKDVALLLRYPGLPASITVARQATFRLQ
jgi:Flp pilus assembly protein TadG